MFRCDNGIHTIFVPFFCCFCILKEASVDFYLLQFLFFIFSFFSVWLSTHIVDTQTHTVQCSVKYLHRSTNTTIFCTMNRIIQANSILFTQHGHAKIEALDEASQHFFHSFILFVINVWVRWWCLVRFMPKHGNVNNVVCVKLIYCFIYFMNSSGLLSFHFYNRMGK